EHGQEAARRLARGPGQLRQLGLRGGDQDVALDGKVALRAGRRDELGQCRGHPALHGLERLARQPLVGAPQPLPERGDQLDRDVRMLAQQAVHVGAEDRDRLGVLRRLHRGRAALAVQHRHLAEDVAWTEVGQGDRAPIGMLPDRPRPSGADDEARAALVACPEYDRPGLELAGHRHLRHVRQVLSGERGEDRNSTQQRDRVLAACGHHAHAYHTGPHPQGQAESSACSRRRRRTAEPTHHSSAATSATGVSPAIAISATPAATVSTRPASWAARPMPKPPLWCWTGAGAGRALMSRPSWLKPTWWFSCASVASSLEIDASASRIWAFRLSICSVVAAFASCLSSEVRSARASVNARCAAPYWSVMSWLASVRDS